MVSSATSVAASDCLGVGSTASIDPILATTAEEGIAVPVRDRERIRVGHEQQAHGCVASGNGCQDVAPSVGDLFAAICRDEVDKCRFTWATSIWMPGFTEFIRTSFWSRSQAAEGIFVASFARMQLR
jgi:hypothetical protein